jgi:hypothetical protein
VDLMRLEIRIDELVVDGDSSDRDLYRDAIVRQLAVPAALSLGRQLARGPAAPANLRGAEATLHYGAQWTPDAVGKAVSASILGAIAGQATQRRGSR